MINIDKKKKKQHLHALLKNKQNKTQLSNWWQSRLISCIILNTTLFCEKKLK